MDIQMKDIQKKETRSERISIRTYKSYSDFMTKKNISPSSLFNACLKELMAKEKKK